jgi:Flp pilus assembly protein CpaB
MAVAPVPYQAPRAKRSSRTLIFVIGAGMAIFAFVAVFVVGISLAAGNSTTHQVTAVVALRDIQPRELITASSVGVSLVSAASLPPHSIVRMADLVGDTALVTIYKGQVLSQNIVANSPDQIDQGTESFLPIPQGLVAITIPTNELQGVGGYVSAGDYINLIASVNTKLLLIYKGQVVDTHDTGMVTRTVFTSIRVIRVGPPVLGPRTGQQQGVSSSLTVVVSECDAQFIDWFINNASLKYVLLSYKDYAPAPAAADASCPSTVAPTVVGPQQVNARWNFTKG